MVASAEHLMESVRCGAGGGGGVMAQPPAQPPPSQPVITAQDQCGCDANAPHSNVMQFYCVVFLFFGSKKGPTRSFELLNRAAAAASSVRVRVRVRTGPGGGRCSPAGL